MSKGRASRQLQRQKRRAQRRCAGFSPLHFKINTWVSQTYHVCLQSYLNAVYMWPFLIVVIFNRVKKVAQPLYSCLKSMPTLHSKLVVLTDLLRGRESFGDLESCIPLPRETHEHIMSCCVVIPWLWALGILQEFSEQKWRTPTTVMWCQQMSSLTHVSLFPWSPHEPCSPGRGGGSGDGRLWFPAH